MRVQTSLVNVGFTDFPFQIRYLLDDDFLHGVDGLVLVESDFD